MPVTYPHILAFPLHMALMTQGDFPFPAVGLVHVQNRIEQRRPIEATEKLEITSQRRRAEAPPEGQDLCASDLGPVRRRGDMGSRRARNSSAAARGPSRQAIRCPLWLQYRQLGTEGPEWSLPADLGRATARLRRPQSDPPLPPDREGARLSAPDLARHVDPGPLRRGGREPPARGLQVEVAFKRPILLPGTVGFGTPPHPRRWSCLRDDLAPRTARLTCSAGRSPPQH